MSLNEQTKFGLTFGQVISVVTLISSVFMVWLSLNIRLAEAEIRIEQLEVGRLVNARNIETIRTENREDHEKMMDKLDNIFLMIKNND